MAFWLLPNTIGNAATGVELISPTVTDPNDLNSDKLNLIAGPRNTYWKSTTDSSAVAIGFQIASDLVATHIVVARADWMVTLAGARLRICNRSSVPAWSNLSSPDINPFATANLMGPTLQDYCVAITPTQNRGYGVTFDSSGAESFKMSKMYASVGFSFSGDIQLDSLPEWKPMPRTQSVNLFIPQQGNEPYEVEADISITWRNNTPASIATFEALPQLRNWPLFIFDDAGDLWSWKLEHVLVDTWQKTLVGQDLWDITVSFKRLKHYE